MTRKLVSTSRRAAVGVSLAVALTTTILSGTPAHATSSCQVTNGATSFSRLQAAVDAASAGDTLVVNGTCMGPFLVGKPLTLVGQPGAALKQKAFTGSATLLTTASTVVVRDLRIGVTPNLTASYHEMDAVYNSGTLVLSHVVIVGNNSCECGAQIFAGIKNEGILSVNDGSVLHWGIKSDVQTYVNVWNGMGARLNFADSTISGGNLGIYSQGNVHVDRSTVNGSWGIASDAGGIWNAVGDLTVNASTIVGNRSINGVGFGIHNEGGLVEVFGSTIARNLDGSSNEGGIQNDGGSVTIAGSILALNQKDCVGTVISFGYNVVGDVGAECGFEALPTDLIGGPSPDSINPRLGPLASNGGPTRTASLKPGSPAIDQIPVGAMTRSGEIALCPASGSTDQRGVARPQGSACDIGSVEG